MIELAPEIILIEFLKIVFSHYHFYYYFQVEDMFEKDQEIFKNIGKKLSEVKQ